jgi:biotin-(acetyl-CoA carboxylase) ligase
MNRDAGTAAGSQPRATIISGIDEALRRLYRVKNNLRLVREDVLTCGEDSNTPERITPSSLEAKVSELLYELDYIEKELGVLIQGIGVNINEPVAKTSMERRA